MNPVCKFYEGHATVVTQLDEVYRFTMFSQTSIFSSNNNK